MDSGLLRLELCLLGSDLFRLLLLLSLLLRSQLLFHASLCLNFLGSLEFHFLFLELNHFPLRFSLRLLGSSRLSLELGFSGSLLFDEFLLLGFSRDSLLLDGSKLCLGSLSLLFGDSGALSLLS